MSDLFIVNLVDLFIISKDAKSVGFGEDIADYSVVSVSIYAYVCQNKNIIFLKSFVYFFFHIFYCTAYI